MTHETLWDIRAQAIEKLEAIEQELESKRLKCSLDELISLTAKRREAKAAAMTAIRNYFTTHGEEVA